MKAKVDFLWYKAGQVISSEDSEHYDVWISEGLVEGDGKAPSKPVEKEEISIASKVVDVVEDLLDDGKINNSNKKKLFKKRK